MKTTDDFGHSLLAMATSSGDEGTFETILAAVTKELEKTEVC